MKVFAVALACLAVALAAPEAPRYRAPAPARNSAPPPPPANDYGAPLNEYGAPSAPSNEYGAPAQANEAPYPPSGWRPSGRQFELPQRQTSSYYAPPADEYGPPPPAPAPATDVTPTEQPTEQEPTTTEQPEGDESAEGAGDARAVATAAAAAAPGAERDGAPAGVYYVLLPDGRLQRVAYSTNPAVPPPAAAPVRNAGFAQLQYMDVEPIRAPIYSYGAPLLRVA